MPIEFLLRFGHYGRYIIETVFFYLPLLTVDCCSSRQLNYLLVALMLCKLRFTLLSGMICGKPKIFPKPLTWLGSTSKLRFLKDLTKVWF